MSTIGSMMRTEDPPGAINFANTKSNRGFLLGVLNWNDIKPLGMKHHLQDILLADIINHHSITTESEEPPRLQTVWIAVLGVVRHCHVYDSVNVLDLRLHGFLYFLK